MTHIYLRRLTVLITVAGLSLFALGGLAFAQTAPTSSVPGCTAGAMYSSTTGQPCSLPASTTVCTNITQNLHLGSQDSTGGIGSQDNVTMLQNFLVAKGYLTITNPSAYGTFGPLTQVAVINFQTASGITPASGFVGPITRALIRELSCGILPTLNSVGISTDSANPVSQTYYVNAISGAEGSVLGVFDVTDDGPGSVNVENISFALSSNATSPIAAYLYQGSSLISSVSVTSSQVSFNNVQLPIDQGATLPLTVKVDMPANTTPGTIVSFGPTVTVSYQNVGAVAVTASGTVTSNPMTFSSVSSNLKITAAPTATYTAGVQGVSAGSIGVSFPIQVTPQPGQEVQPQSTDFQMCYGISLASCTSIPSTNISISPIIPYPTSLTSPLSEGATYTFSVNTTVNNNLVAGNYYYFWLTRAQTTVQDINGNPVPQVYTNLVNNQSTAVYWPGPSTVATSTTGLTISLDSTSPSSQSIPINETSWLAKFRLTNNSQNTVTISQLSFHEIGTANISALSGVKLYDGNENLVIASAPSNISSNVITFYGFSISIPANSSDVIMTDITPPPGSQNGATVGLSINSASDIVSNLSNLNITGPFPVNSNLLTLTGSTPPPSITVLTPITGTILTQGSQTNITWSAPGLPPSQGMDIALNVGSSGTGKIIANNVPNTGSYTWTVEPLQPFYVSEVNPPQLISPTGQYNLYVSCTYGDTNCNFTPNFGQSAIFSIVSPTVTPTTYNPITIQTWSQCNFYLNKSVNTADPVNVACDINNDGSINGADALLFTTGTHSNSHATTFTASVPFTVESWDECSPYMNQKVNPTDPLSVSCDLNKDGVVNSTDSVLFSAGQTTASTVNNSNQSASVIQAIRNILYQLTGSY